MAKPRLSPREIVDRLQTVEALTADGWPLADALGFVRLAPEEYERWRVEYGAVQRLLGPLAKARPSDKRPPPRTGPR